MQTELIEKIIHLPIAERVEIIEKISRSVREDLRGGKQNELSIEERQKAVDRLRGIAAVEGKTPPTDEEIKEAYTDYLLEKYK
jgi:hypothetical protein